MGQRDYKIAVTHIYKLLGPTTVLNFLKIIFTSTNRLKKKKSARLAVKMYQKHYTSGNSEDITSTIE